MSLPAVQPFSLKDQASLIERIWPAQKISVEAQKERKAVQSQTLVSLASYWKGRKPLSLVRACVLGCLLPATDDPEKDLEIFELLMGMDDRQISHRFDKQPTLEAILEHAAPAQKAALLENVGSDEEPDWAFRPMPREQRQALLSSAIARLPYQMRVGLLERAEAIAEDELTGPYLAEVNAHLGTGANSLAELIEQLGVMRFGHRPVVGDTFAGGGSIPFEASRLGCDVFASDLNPIACMLTWGAIEFLGSDDKLFEEFERVRSEVIERLDRRLTDGAYEHNDKGERARIYLYCVEALHQASGWRIPLSPSWILHEGSRTILKLVPRPETKTFDFEVIAGASKAEYARAAAGTIQKGDVVYFDGQDEVRVSIESIRGDKARKRGQDTENNLRPWEASDIRPRIDDIFGERLCAIRWVGPRGEERFSAPTLDDLAVEERVFEDVVNSLRAWQSAGFLPDMAIEAGDETRRLLRERGWTHWHHLFNPRQLQMFGYLMEECATIEDDRIRAAMNFIVGKALNRGSRLCQWQPHRAIAGHVFYNQALNTFYNYGCRAFSYFENIFGESFAGRYRRNGNAVIKSQPAERVTDQSDIFITDPPYADAVNYHEITEFFIAWFRKNPPQPFQQWTWDSRRPLAIKGDGEDFRDSMVKAYKAMADHMPDNGLQVVMFTHQDAGVWADMAQIFWGSGLRVMAAWYIATETTSELKKGGYVQGTVILVLRKRLEAERGYKDEVVQEVKAQVAHQIDTMVGLNQSLRGHGRIENLFEDADLQMAGYAAALRVLTRYAVIDGVDMTKEALRPRKKGERGVVGEIIEFAVQVANEHLVPEGLDAGLWERLNGSERFFMRMLDIETTGAKKLDNYQNFAKAFRVEKDWQRDMMGSLKANDARLRTAAEFKKSVFDGDFGSSRTRAVLFALHEIQSEIEGDLVLSHLRDLVPGYLAEREDLISISAYIARKRAGVVESEAGAARILQGLMRNERLS